MTNEHRKSSHSVFNLQAHIAWITKHRYKVLKRQIGTRVRDLIRRICVEENVEILSGAISPAHVHILVSMDPSTTLRLEMAMTASECRSLKSISNRESNSVHFQCTVV